VVQWVSTGFQRVSLQSSGSRLNSFASFSYCAILSHKIDAIAIDFDTIPSFAAQKLVQRSLPGLPGNVVESHVYGRNGTPENRASFPGQPIGDIIADTSHIQRISAYKQLCPFMQSKFDQGRKPFAACLAP